MKKTLLILALAIFLQSCLPKNYNWTLQTPCKIPNKDFFDKIKGAVLLEGLHIVNYEPQNGYAIFEGDMEYNMWAGANITPCWKFTAINDTLIYAQASKRIEILAYKTTSTVYFGEDTHKDFAWYWNVKNRLEAICERKIIYSKKEI